MRTLCLVFALLSGTAMAQQLTIDALTSGKSLSGNALTQAKFSPDGKRISFLKGKPDKAGQLDLWTFDVATGEARMLVDSATLAGSSKELSDEEKARRERQRIAALQARADELAGKLDGQDAGNGGVLGLGAHCRESTLLRRECGFVVDIGLAEIGGSLDDQLLAFRRQHRGL